MSPIGQTPAPYPTGQSTYPYPGGGIPNGPITMSTGTQCASAMPVLTGTPTPLSSLTDGEDGCIRLASVEQYQDTSSNGVFMSSILNETGVGYDYVSLATRRQRRHGIEVNILRASPHTHNTCSDIRSMALGRPGASINLPLWIDRTSGSIGQTIRVSSGRPNISKAPHGWNLNAFVQTLNAQGFQAVTVGKLPSGDYEIFLSRTSGVPGTNTVVRNLTRAVYSFDY